MSEKNYFDGIYNGKNVLVTGHTGFKGSWLCIWLIESGANVIGYALDPSTPEDNFVLANLHDKMIDIRGDIRDTDKLKSVFDKYQPEIVFHLAAQPIVRLSYEIPKETYEVNVMGTLNVLECIRECKATKVAIMVTTDKCYENMEQVWGYREIDPLGGYDPYSSSKACAEILIASYRKSFMNPENFLNHGKSISSVRAGNVFGGGDWSRDRLIPDCIKGLLNNDPIEIRNPDALRPWQHVLEPLSGYLLLGRKMLEDNSGFCSAWNFGPDLDSIISVGKMVDILVNQWGSGQWIDKSNKDAPHEAGMLNLDCSKARILLGWKPRLNISKALQYTADWYKNYKKVDVYEFCKNQIQEYVKKAVL